MCEKIASSLDADRDGKVVRPTTKPIAVTVRVGVRFRVRFRDRDGKVFRTTTLAMTQHVGDVSMQVSADEAKVLIAQHRGISESEAPCTCLDTQQPHPHIGTEALDHEDIKVLKGDIGRVANCLFKSDYPHPGGASCALQKVRPLSSIHCVCNAMQVPRPGRDRQVL